MLTKLKDMAKVRIHALDYLVSYKRKVERIYNNIFNQNIS
jgi:hypothetical protein